MKTIFDKEAYQEIESRLSKLTTESKAKWGKMDAAQMMAHCTETFKTATGESKRPRLFIGYFLGQMFKGVLINEKPYPQSMKTDQNYIITDKRDFATEKEKLTSVIKRFHAGGEKNATTHPHPFFGKVTQKEWGISMHKHLDHHLTQFGV